MVSHVVAAAFWNVEHETPWTGVVGVPVQRCTIYSAKLAQGAHLAPVAMAIRFENAKVIVFAAASLPSENSTLFLGGDEVVVIWTADVLTRLAPELAPAIQGEFGASD